MNITNKNNLPQPFVDACRSEYEYKPKRYSVTTLLKGTREALLARRHSDEITCDASEMVWAIFGTAVHSVLEKGEKEDWQYQELRLEHTFPNGYTVSGIADFYDEKTQTVTDWKTASIWKVKMNDWEDYRKQLMCYAWLLQQMGYPCKHIEIVALLKDHSAAKASREADYPALPVYTVRWDLTDEAIEQAGKWIQHRIEEIQSAESLDDSSLPLCEPDQRWHKADKWAAKKKGVKRATKLFDNEEEAQAYADANGLIVEYRPGEDTKCLSYCSCAEFCDYWKESVHE